MLLSAGKTPGAPLSLAPQVEWAVAVGKQLPATFAGVKKLRLLFLFPLVACLPACLSLQSDEQKAQAAEKAVLAKHDELMAQMDQLTLLRQQLQQAPGPDTVAAGRRRRALLAADAAMLDWMHGYRKPADTVAVARRLSYFAGQQKKIDSVAGLFRTSIDSARLIVQTTGTLPSSAH